MLVVSLYIRVQDSLPDEVLVELLPYNNITQPTAYIKKHEQSMSKYHRLITLSEIQPIRVCDCYEKQANLTSIEELGCICQNLALHTH